jgi:hypothetical protein
MAAKTFNHFLHANGCSVDVDYDDLTLFITQYRMSNPNLEPNFTFTIYAPVDGVTMLDCGGMLSESFVPTADNLMLSALGHTPLNVSYMVSCG